MIAVGTTVTFTDKYHYAEKADPHNGQTGTVTTWESGAYTVEFSDEECIWAHDGELKVAA